MRAIGAAALAAAFVVPPPPAHAAVHTLTASCRYAAWSRHGFGTLVGVAQSGGDVRPVATSVTCTASDPYKDLGTFTNQFPGPVAVAAGETSQGIFADDPTKCVSAWAFWSDGYSVTAPTVCSDGVATAPVTTSATS